MQLPYIHHHGWSERPNCSQLLSYAICLYCVATYCAMILPITPLRATVPLTLLYIGMTICAVRYGYLCTCTDPTDTAVLAERKASKRGESFDSREFTQICTLCRTHVHDQSKHCGACNRCVDGFDHHCRWVNNCIGRRNFRMFVGLVVALEAELALQVAAGVYTLQGCLWSQEVKNQLKSVYSPSYFAFQAYIAALALFLLTSLILLLTNTQLLLFHCYLSVKGLSTYEYIMKQRQETGKILPKVSEMANHAEVTVMNETTLSKSAHYLIAGEESLESAKRHRSEQQPTFAVDPAANSRK